MSVETVTNPYEADAQGWFGDFGGRFMPEALIAALDELTDAWHEAMADPVFLAEFDAILGFIEQLNEVDVAGVEPMTSVTPMRLRLRADVVTDGGQRDAVLANAPDAREGFFAVPKVVE